MKHTRPLIIHQLVGLYLLIASVTNVASAFLHKPTLSVYSRNDARTTTLSLNKQKEQQQETPSISYEETDASSKGLVSSLTGIVNFFSSSKESDNEITTTTVNNTPPPKTPEELMDRIRDDYVVRNYLWTGNIDLAAFDRQCRFTDPTLSFQGTDQFVKNLNNLVPIVEALTEPGGCKSDLLAIDLNRDEGYVQSRWNMVGSLKQLPWQPRIDVIGRTKFWYKKCLNGSAPGDKEETDEGYQVFFYDEEWEIPAGKALLQLITPPGTIKNTNLQ